MDHTRQRSLFESIAQALAAEPEKAPAMEQAAMVLDIETTFKNMIANLHAVRSDLNKLFTENTVLSEGCTQQTITRLEDTLNGLLADLADLSTRHHK